MRAAQRRRERQRAFNLQHGIEPKSIVKPVADVMEGARATPANAARGRGAGRPVPVAVPRTLAEAGREIKRLEDLMYRHARNLEFEQAAAIRDQIDELRRLELDMGAVATPGSSAPLAHPQAARKS